MTTPAQPTDLLPDGYSTAPETIGASLGQRDWADGLRWRSDAEILAVADRLDRDWPGVRVVEAYVEALRLLVEQRRARRSPA